MATIAPPPPRTPVILIITLLILNLLLLNTATFTKLYHIIDNESSLGPQLKLHTYYSHAVTIVDITVVMDLIKQSLDSDWKSFIFKLFLKYIKSNWMN